MTSYDRSQGGGVLLTPASEKVDNGSADYKAPHSAAFAERRPVQMLPMGGDTSASGGHRISSSRSPPEAVAPAPAADRADSPRRYPDAAVASLVDTLRVSSKLLIGEREHRLYVLAPEKISYIEAHGNYVKFHVGNAEYISYDTIKRLAPFLADAGFVRIERSILINIRAILYAQRAARHTYVFTLVCGATVHSGPAYLNDMLRILPFEPRTRKAVNRTFINRC